MEILAQFRTRARWIDRFAPVPSPLWLLPLFLLVAWDGFNLLRRGFWIDECGAFWLSQHLPSFTQPSFDFKDLGFLYAAILSLFNWGEPPFFEFVARLPSLLAVCGCAVILYSLSERVNGKGTGWIASMVYLLLPTTLEFATQARPYAIGQFVFAATLWMLDAWFKHGRTWILATHLAGLLFLAYLHPFFVLAWPLCGIYVILARPQFRQRYLLASLAASLLLAPFVYMFLHLESQVSTISYMGKPGWRMLGIDLVQNRLGLAMGGALILAAVLGARPRLAGTISVAWGVLWLAWPLALFAAARITGSTFYMPRYLALSAVGFALLAAALLQWWRPMVRQAAMVLVVLLHLAPGNPARQPHFPDLRELAEWMEGSGGGATAPWIATSFFIEGALPDASPAAVKLASWTFAHLSIYPVMNPVFPMPNGLAESGRAALEAQLDGPWKAERRILAGPVQTPPAWFLEALSRRGYRLRHLGALLEFQR